MRATRSLAVRSSRAMPSKRAKLAGRSLEQRGAAAEIVIRHTRACHGNT